MSVVPGTSPLKDIEVQAPWLTTRFVRFVHFDETDSTNDEAWRELGKGGPDCTVVTATRQTSGRGRLGRRWSSPRGNLYLSILRRMREGLEHSPGMAIVAGVALALAVEEVTGISVDLKWPNDVWVGGKKLGGILLEGRLGWIPGPQRSRTSSGIDHEAEDGDSADAEPKPEDWQVVGIGLNVNVPVASLSEELHSSATTLLHLTGREWSLGDIAMRFLDRFAGFEESLVSSRKLPLAEYRSRFPFVGHRAAVYYLERQVEGTISGIDEDGALLMVSQGKTIRVVSGEVIHVRPR